MSNWWFVFPRGNKPLDIEFSRRDVAMRYSTVVSCASLLAGTVFAFSTSAWAAGGMSPEGIGVGGAFGGIGVGGAHGGGPPGLAGGGPPGLAGGGPPGLAGGGPPGLAGGGPPGQAGGGPSGSAGGSDSGGASSGPDPSDFGSGSSVSATSGATPADVSSRPFKGRGPIGAFDGPSGLSATIGRYQFGAVSPSAAWASLPGLDPHVMGAPLPEADYPPQNNQFFPPRMREARSSTDATIGGRRVSGAAPSPVSVSTPSLADAMVDASKQRVQRLESDKAAIDLKTPKLSRIGKLRKARHRAYSSKDPASDQLSLTSDQLSLTITDAPAPRSRSAEPGRVAKLVRMLSMSALVLLVAALVVMALMPRRSAYQ